MISFDLECANEHRFEGIFKDFASFEEQLKKEMIECPLCGDNKIKRLFTGCSIQSSGSSSYNKDALVNNNGNHTDRNVPQQGSAESAASPDIKNMNIFQMMRIVRDYVTKNFENVGRDFADKARAIHYGVEEEKKIYGESTPAEIKELIDEGIDVLALPNTDTDV